MALETDMGLFVQLIFLISLIVCNTNGREIKFSQFDAVTFGSSLMRSTKLQQVAVDSNTGNVYVGGRNTLYYLDGNLTLKESHSLGPVKDNQACMPDPLPCSHKRQFTDTDVKVLEIHPTQRYLLVCGSTQQGMCSIYSTTTPATKTTMDPANTVNFVAGRRSAIGFFGKGPSKLPNLQTVFYVAQTYDGRLQNLSAKAVSTRKVELNSKTGKYDFSYMYAHPESNTYSAIDIASEVKLSYIVKYVYGFEDQGFTYYLTIQRRDTTEYSDFHTRLVRICQNDPGYYSYTEVPLSCRKSPGSTIYYNLSQSAYYGNIGEELASELGITANEMVLYVAFGRSLTKSVVAEQKEGSGLCLYSMKDIRKAFTDAQRYCYRVGQAWRLLKWIHYSSPTCTYDPMEASKIDDNYCGSNKNVGIGARTPLEAVAEVTDENTSMTSVAVTRYEKKTIAVIGNNEGELLKVHLDGTKSSTFVKIPVSTQPIEKDVAFDADEKHLYVLSGTKITKVAVQTCAIYSGCAECVTSTDPLECGWCGDRCSTKKKKVPTATLR